MADPITILRQRQVLYIFPKGEIVAAINTRRNLRLYPLPPTPEWRQAPLRRASIFANPSISGKAIVRKTLILNNRAASVEATSLSRSFDSTGRTGYGKIESTIVIDGYPNSIPTGADILLIRLRDRKVLNWTTSNSTTGAYSFSGLNKDEKYATVAFHPVDTFFPTLDSGIKPT